MQLTITTVDYAPPDLYEQVPIVVKLIRQVPGDDREDYWLGVLKTPIHWLVEDRIREVTHLVVVARWQGTSIADGVKNLPVGIAYVTDDSILNDVRLDLAKCSYVAIGIATETEGGTKPDPLEEILVGNIAPGFGTGKAR